MPRASGAVRKLYSTQAWSLTRAAYFKKVGGLCENCLLYGLYTPGRQVHHKVPVTEQNMHDERIAFGFDNLVLLCEKCHHEIHDNHMKPGRRRWRLDEDGNVMEPVDGA